MIDKPFYTSPPTEDEMLMDTIIKNQKMIFEYLIKEKAKRWLRHFEKKYPGWNLKTIRPIIDHGSFGAIFEYKEIIGHEDVSDYEKYTLQNIALHYAWIKYFFGVE